MPPEKTSVFDLHYCPETVVELLPSDARNAITPRGLVRVALLCPSTEKQARRSTRLALLPRQGDTGGMAEILLFHHAYGLTDGLRALAARLIAEGHTVHCPDCYAGATFRSIDEGVKHLQRIGHDAVEDVARRSAREFRNADVVMGFGLGAMQAQLLTQDLRRIRGCLLMGGAYAPKALGGVWRSNASLEIHLSDPDEWVQPAELEGLLYHAPHARVYRYANKGHLFIDECSRDYDADAADLFEERLETWLADLDEQAAELELARNGF